MKNIKNYSYSLQANAGIEPPLGHDQFTSSYQSTLQEQGFLSRYSHGLRAGQQPQKIFVYSTVSNIWKTNIFVT
jgi:hypothetical protein